MQYAKGGSCQTGWVWINIYWLETLSPDSGSAVWCAFRVGLGIFYFLQTRVVKTILAAADLIWDVGGQKMKFWGQTMLLLSPALSQSFEGLLGTKPPWKGAVKFSECLLELLSLPEKDIWPNTKKGGGKPLTHNFACSLFSSSSPKQQKKFGTRSFELVIAQRQ